MRGQDINTMEGEREAQVEFVIGPLENPEIKFRVFPLQAAPRVLRLLAELGIANREAEALVLILAPGLFYGSQFKDYTAELIATWVPSLEGTYPCTAFSYKNICPYPALILRRRIFHRAEEVWSPDPRFNQVMSPDRPTKPYLEAVWCQNPEDRMGLDNGEHVSLRGVEYDRTGIDIALALKGRELLHRIKEVKPGRPPALKDLTLDHLVTLCACLWGNHFYNRASRPTEMDIITLYDVNRTTLYRHLRRLNTSWSAVKESGKEHARNTSKEFLLQLFEENFRQRKAPISKISSINGK